MCRMDLEGVLQAFILPLTQILHTAIAVGLSCICTSCVFVLGYM